MASMARSRAQRPLPGLPDGSHMAMFDDQQRYFAGLVRFLHDVDQGR